MEMDNDYTCIKLKRKIPFPIEMFHSLLIFARLFFLSLKIYHKTTDLFFLNKVYNFCFDGLEQ